jgi:hypothetical protein
MFILHINSKYAQQNRALLSTQRIHQSNNNMSQIILYSTESTLLIGHTRQRVICVFPRGHLCRGNCSGPIARTMCLSTRLGSLVALFSSRWITFGFANFSSYSKSITRRTLACSITLRLRLCTGRVQGPAEGRA